MPMPDAARKTLLLVVLAAIWEVYARSLNNPLLFPTLSATVSALSGSIASGELPRAIGYTLTLLGKGYAVGLVLAVLLTAFASEIGRASCRDRVYIGMLAEGSK